MASAFACPCCGFLTLCEGGGGTFEICPICYWEDDDLQNRDPSYPGGANTLSLREARANFLRYGAMMTEMLQFVRAPLPGERPLPQ
jgi:hypothetical protein